MRVAGGPLPPKGGAVADWTRPGDGRRATSSAALRARPLRRWARARVASSDEIQRSASSAAIAAHAGGGDRLAVRVVDDVAGREHAGRRSSPSTPGFGQEVAGLVHVELADEELRCSGRGRSRRRGRPRDLRASRPSRVRGPGRRRAWSRRRATSSTTASSTNSIFSFARARSTMIGEARNSSRRWTSVDLRRRTSSGRSPPPSPSRRRRRPRPPCSRKNAASQTAQYDTPRPCSALLGLEAELAGGRAGGDDHGLGAVLALADPDAGTARSEKSTSVTSSVRNSAPKRSACARKSCIISGPEHAVRVARVVLDVARDHELAAPREALDHERLEVRARARTAPPCSRRARRR